MCTTLVLIGMILRPRTYLHVMKGKWLSSGEKVNKFEKQFSDHFGFDHSVMVNSGSSAKPGDDLAALKKYFGWEDGDEIIVCSCGFATTIALLFRLV